MNIERGIRTEMDHQLNQIVEGFLNAKGGLGTQKVVKQSGEALFSAGDKGHFMFIVEKGEIGILHEGETLETVGAGGIVGEMAFFDDEGVRSADAVATCQSTLFPINRRRFRELVQRNPDFALEVMKIQARRLREMNERLGST